MTFANAFVAGPTFGRRRRQQLFVNRHFMKRQFANKLHTYCSNY